MSEPLACRAAWAFRCWGRMKKKYPRTPIATSGRRVKRGLDDDFAAATTKSTSAGVGVMRDPWTERVANCHPSAWVPALWGSAGAPPGAGSCPEAGACAAGGGALDTVNLAFPGSL